MARPVLSYGSKRRVGAFATYGFATWGMGYAATVVDNDVVVETTDDMYRRILTWHLEKGMGKQFNIKWLKRRIMQFLYGENGVPFNVDQTYDVSITFGANHEVNINFRRGVSTLLRSSAFAVNAFATYPLGAVEVSFTPLPIPDNAQALKAAIQSGALELPFQYRFIVNI
jgi:hypothetical protein